MTLEEKAWQQNGAQLTASVGSVQTKDEIHLSACRDVAICELSFATGKPDYTLFLDGTTFGVVEPSFSALLTRASQNNLAARLWKWSGGCFRF